MNRLWTLIILTTLTNACAQNQVDICELGLTVGNGLTFHPKNGIILISKPTGNKDKNDKNQYSIYNITTLNQSFERVLNTSLNSDYTDYHPVFSPKGEFMLFNSTRPNPKSNMSSGKTDIWISKYRNGIFEKPEYIEALNSPSHDSYPTLTKTNKVYFNSDRPSGQGMMDIYVSEFKEGQWLSPKLVPKLNSVHSENDLVVDPDERFIIINRYTSETKEIDLFISYNENRKWSEPIPLDSINKSNIWELTPTLSLDGKILYIEVNGGIQCYDITEIVKN